MSMLEAGLLPARCSAVPVSDYKLVNNTVSATITTSYPIWRTVAIWTGFSECLPAREL